MPAAAPPSASIRTATATRGARGRRRASVAGAAAPRVFSGFEPAGSGRGHGVPGHGGMRPAHAIDPQGRLRAPTTVNEPPRLRRRDRKNQPVTARRHARHRARRPGFPPGRARGFCYRRRRGVGKPQVQSGARDDDVKVSALATVGSHLNRLLSPLLHALVSQPAATPVAATTSNTIANVVKMLRSRLINLRLLCPSGLSLPCK